MIAVPGNPWMVDAYADGAPYPFASIVGQEIFETGFIPSDTDYRIFRDYGNLPGMLKFTLCLSKINLIECILCLNGIFFISTLVPEYQCF